jgi:hypothetical protein
MRCQQTSRKIFALPTKVLRVGLLVAGLILITAMVAGCGESDADKAEAQVCDSVADMKVQVNELSTLTPATATADGVESNLSAIDDDLNQIKDVQGDLSDDRKQQVESATQEFASEAEAVAAGLGSNLSLTGAKAKLETAGRQLASSYQKAFAQVDCGS